MKVIIKVKVKKNETGAQSKKIRKELSDLSITWHCTGYFATWNAYIYTVYSVYIYIYNIQCIHVQHTVYSCIHTAYVWLQSKQKISARIKTSRLPRLSLQSKIWVWQRGTRGYSGSHWSILYDVCSLIHYGPSVPTKVLGDQNMPVQSEGGRMLV